MVPPPFTLSTTTPYGKDSMRPKPKTESPHTSLALPHYGYRPPVVPDWRELVEGDSITLLPPNSHDDSISGTVDAVSPDGSILWLVQKGPAGRRMFHHIDGYKTLLGTPAPK